MIRCRACDSLIAFKRLPNGKFCPTEPDGSDHFDHCSERRFARLKRDGERVEVSDQKGLVHSGYALDDVYKKDFERGDVIVGANYVPCPVECPIPPWKDCPCPHRTSRKL